MITLRSGPDQSLYIQIPHIELSMSHTQYLSLLQINAFFTRTGSRDNNSLVRRDILNEGGVSSLSSHPRLLWKYGIRCVIRNIRRLKCTYKQSYLHEMWTTGQSYHELYLRRLQDRCVLSEVEMNQLRECENILPTPTILLWRSLAEAEIQLIQKVSIFGTIYGIASKSSSTNLVFFWISRRTTNGSAIGYRSA